ncbi:phosphoribosyltransferase, putative (plasmid) [Acaryochloris marina MBIC11017]|uniref:Phosphoribosyltransferase, putative n=2 Tax=Acaryochloris marina TaxID=155978 RepID=A8ZN13_ACAM1|nr:phosphoribosyltransferase, putative [Acaryochloris marina MBIC11017]
MPLLRNRADAGQQLATQLTHYVNQSNVLVIALPRGGVPVAFEIAKELNAPLDLCLVRKLGVPGMNELAMGAITSDGVILLNDEVVSELDISPQIIEQVATNEMRELCRQAYLYQDDRPPSRIHDHILILVDDGIATATTIRAAIVMLQKQQPCQIVVAAPVIKAGTYETLKTEVEEVVFLINPKPLYSIGFWYEDFSQTSDEELKQLLAIKYRSKYR